MIYLLILIIPYTELIAWAYYKQPVFFSCVAKYKMFENKTQALAFAVFNELYTKAVFLCAAVWLAMQEYNFHITTPQKKLASIFIVSTFLISLIISRKPLLSLSSTLYFTKEVIYERYTKATRQ